MLHEVYSYLVQDVCKILISYLKKAAFLSSQKEVISNFTFRAYFDQKVRQGTSDFFAV